MENKYYTPTIDEFHVGFEYELFRHPSYGLHSDCNESEMKWVVDDDFSDTFCDYEVDSIGEVGCFLNDNRIRVKYLNKEDIESLGFIQRDNIEIQHLFGPINLKSDEEQIIYTKTITEFGGLTAYLHFYSNRSTNYGTILSIHKDLTNPYNQKQLFYGAVKNKSELVKLLKMLGIND